MNNPVIQTDIADILGQINQKLDKLTEDVTELKTKDLTELKVGQVEIKGEIKSLETKVEQLDKRVGNHEFIPIRGQANRGILIGIVVIILGGAAKLFGIVGSP